MGGLLPKLLIVLPGQDDGSMLQCVSYPPRRINKWFFVVVVVVD